MAPGAKRRRTNARMAAERTASAALKASADNQPVQTYTGEHSGRNPVDANVRQPLPVLRILDLQTRLIDRRDRFLARSNGWI